jgi:GNAT superfamily N-acetyltransferase
VSDPLRLEPASTIPLERLAQLFTAAYEGYAIPVHFDVDGVERLVETNDVDLEAGRIAVAGADPVGLCMLGIRGDEGWIGGMGVTVSHRRRGIGEALMHAVLDEAHARGIARVRLEVLAENDAARLLYEKLGFRRLRAVDVWTLAADVTSSDSRHIPVEEAHAFVRRHRTAEEPWQRSDGTLTHLDGLEAIAVDGGSAVYRVAGSRVLLLQAAAIDERAAAALVAALRARGESLVVVNLPDDDLCAAALAGHGGRVDVRQHEMALEL